MITWPAILVHADDPELDYLASSEVLENHLFDLDESDRLIDSNGIVFSVSSGNMGEALLHNTGEIRSLDQVLGLVKAHAAQAEYCCVAKLWAPTIADAYSIVSSLSDD